MFNIVLVVLAYHFFAKFVNFFFAEQHNTINPKLLYKIIIQTALQLK